MTKKKDPSLKKKTGRPSRYNPELHPDTARSLARKGKTNQQIAEALGVNLDTVQTWINTYPEFSEALKEGKAPADAKVERCLFQRAIGYKITEKKVIQLPDGTVRKEVTEKEIAPDTTAQIFWLKNRLPGEWRDKVQQEITGKDGAPIKTETTLNLAAEVKKYARLLNDVAVPK